MVFKPWTERTPRHTFEEVNQLIHSEIPKVHIDLATDSIPGQLLIIPNILSFLQNSLLKQFPKNELIGTVSIHKSVKQFGDEVDDEYLEEEQLYKSTEESKSLKLDQELKIYKLNSELSVLLIPIFTNDIILFNIISKKIHNSFNNILTITPGILPFNQSIATLGHFKDEFNHFTPLKPPFHITGISASLLNQSNSVNGNVQCLVLKSEGIMGYEKIDLESIENLINYLQWKFKLSNKFKQNIENSLKINNSSNNFGLYL